MPGDWRERQQSSARVDDMSGHVSAWVSVGVFEWVNEWAIKSEWVCEYVSEWLIDLVIKWLGNWVSESKRVSDWVSD